jgi:hypothetical protein
MGVRDRLSRSRPVIDPDGETVGSELLQQRLPYECDQTPQVNLLTWFQVVDAWDVATRYDQAVAFSDRKHVPDCSRVLALVPDLLRINVAERARFVHETLGSL